MRAFFPLVAVALLSCDGTTGTPRPDPEICDDLLDNDGDGFTDCDDSDCGGLVCQGDDDDDTGTIVPPLTVEIIRDPKVCCDFTMVPGVCPLDIGSFIIINRSTKLDGEFDASCDLVGPGASAIEFQVQGGASGPMPFLVNLPLNASSQVAVDASFSCEVSQGFTTTCRVKATVGEEEAEDTWVLTGASPTAP